MTNSFNYSLKAENFIDFERFYFKKFVLPRSFIFFAMFAAVLFVEIFSEKNPYIIGICAAAAAVFAFSLYYRYTVGIKKKVNKYINCDSAYLGEVKLTMDSYTAQWQNIPSPGEAEITTVYPFSVMNVIYDTEKFYCFQVGTEAKILPKDVIPPLIKVLVDGRITQQKNYVKIK